jgi:excisionase family DNA binding protein
MPENAESSTKLISLAEAAKLSGLTHDHLRRMAREGKLEATKIGRDWLPKFCTNKGTSHKKMTMTAFPARI